ncbi:hypothetical protein CALVIDRAFT_419120 [Calocera viscosa TUFC12733]|uniref:Hemerythrin-like domain-containing protein n=1 Tax=Calocera viscosa (strain TUFC12733) TaxID=1330018 RepID=A0A167PHI2_CALVF|nr:hypothetical protein CALVIDRAFT_419120 [Calocera viscosa TUFC12733]
MNMSDSRWSRVSDKLATFHGFLAAQLDATYELADGTFQRRGMSLQTFISEVADFKRQLETHINTEARHVYPILAQRMPAFAPGQRLSLAHSAVRRGLDGIDSIVSKTTASPPSYNGAELRQCIDSFRGTLYALFADELRELHPANMQRYWSLNEVIALPV